VVELAHRLGGAAVLAHPLRHHHEPAPVVWQTPFDACETRSLNIDPDQHEQYSQLATCLGIPELYSSDAHETYAVGAYGCFFHAPVRDEKELAQVIRAGAFEPRVQPFWCDPALTAKIVAWENRIRRLIAQGAEAPEAIWVRTGGSLERVRRVWHECVRSTPA
jgi:hypothetical protein